MNIGFDGKRAANNFTGLGNYSRSLIAHLAMHFPQNQYLVYTKKIRDNPQIRALENAENNVSFRLPDQTSSGILWRSLGIKKQLIKDKIDLFHGLSHEIPIGLPKTGIPGIVTIHDLIFIKYPQYYKFIDRMIYKLKIRYACKYADKIIAISNRTKLDIIAEYGVAPEKIEVIYQSCDDSFKLKANEAIKKQVSIKYQLPEKYILNVGTIEPRKNLITLIRALKEIHESYKLVVIGKKTPYFKLVDAEIESLGLAHRVIFLKDVPFSDLPAIYQLSSIFVYPSLYEGFGIPILEALYAEVPVVAATGSCLEEAGGEHSLYVAPTDHNMLAKAVNEILMNPILQKEMIAQGLKYAQQFNHQQLSEQLMQVYQQTRTSYGIRKNKI